MRPIKVRSLRVVNGPDELRVADEQGVVVARFALDRRSDANAFAMLPTVIALLDAVVDGAEGYLSEVGEDDQYWQQGVVDRGRDLADALIPWARATI